MLLTAAVFEGSDTCPRRGSSRLRGIFASVAVTLEVSGV